MGADYIFHTEAQVTFKDGRKEWICIDPILPFVWYEANKYERRLRETYWNGSRTYFSETYDELTNIMSPVKISDLSKELREIYDDESCETFLRQIDYEDLIALSPGDSSYDRFGYIPKAVRSMIDRHELFDEDISDDELLTPKEFASLSSDERDNYTFYGWNDPYGWKCHVRTLAKRVQDRVLDAEKFDLFLADVPKYRVISYLSV